MSIINYKEKALKYKLKYMDLKIQYNRFLLGGSLPAWYTGFLNDLVEIYESVENKYKTPVLTGSGAIAYLLYNLDMLEDLDELTKNNANPHDLDFLYISKTALTNPNEILDYKLNPTQQTESSVTFSLPNSNDSDSNTRYIKSFDISKVRQIKSFVLGGIRIINLNNLKSFYVPDIFYDEERKKKDSYKKALVEKIIKQVHTEKRLHEFGLDEFVTTRDTTNTTKSSKLFDSDDESNIKISKLNNQEIIKKKIVWDDEESDEESDNFKPRTLF